MEQFKALDDDWRQIGVRAKNYPSAEVSRAVLELRDRVAALEAAPDRFIVRNESGVYQRAGTPVYLAAPAKAVPSDEELWKIWYDTQEEGAIVHFRALFDHGYQQGLAAGRAEQQAAPEESSAAQSDPQVLFSVTLAGSNAIRWEDVINALSIAEAKLFCLWEYSKGIEPWCLQVADTAYPAYQAVHDLMNECRRTGATGAIGGLASPPPSTPEPEPEPSPSPADGWLIAALEGIGLDGKTACFTLLLVARWLSRKNYDDSAAELEQEANR